MAENGCSPTAEEILKETQNHQPPCYNKYKKISKRRSLRPAYSLQSRPVLCKSKRKSTESLAVTAATRVMGREADELYLRITRPTSYS
jgi:hypothetical protein